VDAASGRARAQQRSGTAQPGAGETPRRDGRRPVGLATVAVSTLAGERHTLVEWLPPLPRPMVLSTRVSLEGLTGRWFEGQVHGTLVDAGWGASLGYPALVLDPLGPPVEVVVFESPDLPAHWSRLDRFEGPGYRRVTTTVRTRAGDLEASVYILRVQDEQQLDLNPA
jgi:gamma-glutamylcyclotransferase (GGCT)/AIG2-like uncharacterized protein YtfP